MAVIQQIAKNLSLVVSRHFRRDVSKGDIKPSAFDTFGLIYIIEYTLF